MKTGWGIGAACMLLVLAAGCDADSKQGAAAEHNPVVVMDTTYGPITIELFQDKAPGTVKNFLAYVDSGFYNGTLFHRVIRNFMIQGGGFVPDENGTGVKEKQPAQPSIRNESANGLSNTRGTLAMARTSEPNSATCQFFINVVDNKRLDRAECPDGVGYCVFGKVIDGMDVVDQIRNVKTHMASGMPDVPLHNVVIKSVRPQQQK